MYAIPTSDNHNPRQSQIICLDKSAVELGWHAGNEPNRKRACPTKRQRNQHTAGIDRQQVVVFGEHVNTKEVECAVIEVEVPSGAVIRFAGVKHRICSTSRSRGKTLLRSPVQIERTEVQASMIARPCGASGLNGIAAFCITL